MIGQHLTTVPWHLAVAAGFTLWAVALFARQAVAQVPLGLRLRDAVPRLLAAVARQGARAIAYRVGL